MNVKLGRCSPNHARNKVYKIIKEKLGPIRFLNQQSSKVIFGSAQKKGFDPLSVTPRKGNDPEPWNDQIRMRTLDVDQLLEGVASLKQKHLAARERCDRE